MKNPISFPPGKLPAGILERLLRTYTSSIHGRITGKEQGVKFRREGRIRDLPRFDRDEITKILSWSAAAHHLPETPARWWVGPWPLPIGIPPRIASVT